MGDCLPRREIQRFRKEAEVSQFEQDKLLRETLAMRQHVEEATAALTQLEIDTHRQWVQPCSRVPRFDIRMHEHNHVCYTHLHLHTCHRYATHAAGWQGCDGSMPTTLWDAETKSSTSSQVALGELGTPVPSAKRCGA